MTLHLVPVSFRDAQSFVNLWHRHHRAPIGCKFCVGVADAEAVLRAVLIAGRPVARMLDDGMTLEVTRTATDGTFTANSMLYGAARRAAWALGYRRLVTYTHRERRQAALRRRIVDVDLRDVARVRRDQHGRLSTYTNHGCRCEPCAAAMREYNREYNRDYRRGVRRRAVRVGQR